MKRYKMKHQTRVLLLAKYRRKYAQAMKLDAQDIFVQTLLEELEMRIRALEYLLG